MGEFSQQRNMRQPESTGDTTMTATIDIELWPGIFLFVLSHQPFTSNTSTKFPIPSRNDSLLCLPYKWAYQIFPKSENQTYVANVDPPEAKYLSSREDIVITVTLSDVAYTSDHQPIYRDSNVNITSKISDAFVLAEFGDNDLKQVKAYRVKCKSADSLNWELTFPSGNLTSKTSYTLQLRSNILYSDAGNELYLPHQNYWYTTVDEKCTGHGVFHASTGRCECSSAYAGFECSYCDIDYEDVDVQAATPNCVTKVCRSDTCNDHGSCSIGPNQYALCACDTSKKFSGQYCDQCEPGFGNYPNCVQLAFVITPHPNTYQVNVATKIHLDNSKEGDLVIFTKDNDCRQAANSSAMTYTVGVDESVIVTFTHAHVGSELLNICFSPLEGGNGLFSMQDAKLRIVDSMNNVITPQNSSRPAIICSSSNTWQINLMGGLQNDSFYFTKTETCGIPQNNTDIYKINNNGNFTLAVTTKDMAVGIYKLCWSHNLGANFTQQQNISLQMLGNFSVNINATNVRTCGGTVTTPAIHIDNPYPNMRVKWVETTSKDEYDGIDAVIPPGNYCVNVCGYIPETCEQCYEQCSIIVAQANSLLTLSISTKIDPKCFGARTGSFTVKIQGGSPPYIIKIRHSSPSRADYEFTNTYASAGEKVIGDLESGIYQLVVNDSVGCMAANQEVIVLTDPKEILATVSKSDILCHGDKNGAISIDVSQGASPYTVSIGGGHETLYTFDTARFTKLEQGSYTAIVTDVKGCSVNISNLVIKEPDTLTVSVNSRDVSAYGAHDGAVTVGAAGGTPPYTYVWSNNWESPSLTGLGAGTYAVIITDSKGCSLNLDVIIHQPASPSSSSSSTISPPTSASTTSISTATSISTSSASTSASTSTSTSISTSTSTSSSSSSTTSTTTSTSAATSTSPATSATSALPSTTTAAATTKTSSSTTTKYPTSTASISSSTTTPSKTVPADSNSGKTIGIAVGVAAGVVLAIGGGVAYYLIRRKRLMTGYERPPLLENTDDEERL